MRLKQSVMLGLTVLSLGLSIFGCSGTPAETEEDRKAKASESKGPPATKPNTDSPPPKMPNLPPPKG